MYHGLTEEEAIAAGMQACAEEVYIEFSGWNCADVWDGGNDCQGWDGDDRRCDCGNRRVGWETEQNADGSWTAYAVAW